MRLRTRLIALGVVLALLGGCVFEPGSPASRLADAMQRWDRAGIRDYEVTVSVMCFCGFPAGSPVRVRVEDGVVVSRTFVDSGDPVPAQFAARFPDVPGLFVEVQKAYVEADEVEVRFDSALGFPTVIDVDRTRNAIDDEVRWTTEGLQRL